MDKVKILRNKPVKLLTLLLTSMLIATASAAVYNYMYMEASIGVEAAEVQFVDGADAVCDIGDNATYVKINDMAGWPNATRVYEEAVKVESLDASDRTVELAFDSWSGNTNNVTYIYVKVFNAAGVQQGSTLSITPAAQNSTGTFTLTALATYRVQWGIKWDGGALSTYAVDVMLKMIVTGA